MLRQAVQVTRNQVAELRKQLDEHGLVPTYMDEAERGRLIAAYHTGNYDSQIAMLGHNPGLIAPVRRAVEAARSRKDKDAQKAALEREREEAKRKKKEEEEAKARQQAEAE